MCGIAGLINCGSKETLERMTEVIRHRGPDDQGIQWFSDTRCGLGHRRLSIIDLSPTGHQPMSSDDETLWITYNGEIYNYKEIRNELVQKGHRFRSSSDTEVILKAYEQWGERFLDKLNGMFALAIYDIKNRKFLAARDRIGIKPFYYWSKNGALVFASEIKSILATGLVEKKPDYYSLHTPTRFQIAPYTGFEDILKLPQGHFLTLKDGAIDIHKYWDIDVEENRPSLAEAKDRLDSLLSDSVRLQMIADVPVGVFLSGGLDSSIVCALIRKQTSQPINSYTIKFSQADQRFEKMPDDSVYAQKVAERFGLTHHEFEISPDIENLLPKMVWHLDEPLSDPAAINTYLIAKAARETGIIVLLNGMGGDEVFGGYRKQLACLRADIYQAVIPGFLRRAVEASVNAIPVASPSQGFRYLRWAKRFMAFASLPQAERFLASDLSLSSSQYQRYFMNGADYYHSHYFLSQNQRLNDRSLAYLTRMCLNDTKVMLTEHNLLYSDKASMAASIESRPPLLDHRIVEFLFSLAPRYRINGNVQKFLLKEVATRYLPNGIIDRPKAPFGSPLRSWIRGALRQMVDEYLSEECVSRRGLYDPAFVQQLVRRDRVGVEDNAHLIWTLLTNEIWFRTYFGN